MSSALFSNGAIAIVIMPLQPYFPDLKIIFDESSMLGIGFVLISILVPRLCQRRYALSRSSQCRYLLSNNSY
ncbi:hypothetical protein [Chamaesiphon polymorphus]|uniref:hypothetical protein n=1 Tax=Chamaesiphon polymorphus TaxID=2107691 RepID=UPI0011B21D05|nr:hypothetical protein [Chamaesiphon polymorphus]